MKNKVANICKNVFIFSIVLSIIGFAVLSYDQVNYTIRFALTSGVILTGILFRALGEIIEQLYIMNINLKTPKVTSKSQKSKEPPLSINYDDASIDKNKIDYKL